MSASSSTDGLGLVRQRLDAGLDIGLGLRKFRNGDPFDALDQDPERAVRDLDHLKDPRHGPHGIDIR